MLEDQWFERKSSRISAPDLAKALIAFANAEGGTVAVGFHDGRPGTEPPPTHRENGLRQAAADHTRPAVRHTVQRIDVGDGRTALPEGRTRRRFRTQGVSSRLDPKISS